MEYIGKTNRNSNGTMMKIVGFRNKSDIDIQFLDEHKFIKEHCAYINFKNGTVKNPFDKTIYGVGYIGVGKYKVSNHCDIAEAYACWHSMLERCYYEKKKDKFPAYYDICTVCDEWMCYQDFAEWFEEHKYSCDGYLQLDKDILHPGNKVYSPEHCMLVPHKINAMFINKPNKRGLPNGIRYESGKYNAKYNHKDLGEFDSVEDAYEKYAEEKQNKIIEVANELKDVIPNYVYETLVNHRFNIMDDKNYKAS